MGKKHIIKWILSGFVSLIIILSISYVITRKDSDSEKMDDPIPITMQSDRHMGEKNPYKKPDLKHKKHFSKKNLKDSTALGVKEESNEFLRSKGYAKADNFVKGVGLSVDGLKVLHARQDLEIKQMIEDTDSIVIPPVKEGDPGITVGELLALQRKQKVEIEKAYNRDEIVIPASQDGSPGLSRNELTVLHEQQERELEIKNERDEIVIPASENGYPGLSRNELIILQDQQNYEIWEDIDNFYEPVAPSPEEGGPNLTVYELKEVHKRQSLN